MNDPTYDRPATRPTRRVQRVPETWPVVHLEADPPRWSCLTVGGLVRSSGRFDLAALRELGPVRLNLAVHCVWGWSRPRVTWDGVPLGRLLETAGVDPTATHAVIEAASDTYSSCLPLEDAVRGMLAWARDGEILSDEGGGPLRYVGPPTYWGYKGVKWASQVRLTDRFTAGFWESKVADPFGRIPEEIELP
ncbi:MAG TPA: molybdopterin-dependent oxidoreductase [Acidimicrobiales bacterium]|nr:molybdopterin-dependent oxidoreductase [Acidimicrobiales bacterium]